MSLHHHILATSYYPIKLVKAIGRPLGLTPPANQLRVLLYHDIDPRDQANFAAQMRWLKRSWNFVSAEQFAAMVSGHEPILRRSLLLAFDDGFASNRVVAEEVLNPLGIQALFFVMSDFVDMEDVGEARQFIAQNIYPGTSAAELPAHWRNMGWSDLEALLQMGHCIGGHTRTHARLSQIKTEFDLEREIIASANVLEQRLSVPVEHFAYTFGDLASFSDQALAVARRRFRFIYSGLRGDNAGGVEPYALRRDSAAFQDAFSNYSVFSNNLLGAFLEGTADFKYAEDVDLLSSWGRQV
jgi:peptidoglycan/xylan/chitin deacetylase (PgdA/CDA1 family)